MIIVKVPAEQEPPAQPPPHVDPRLGFAATLIDTNGKEWDLVAGPVFILAGSGGFGAPDPEHWWRTAAAVDGSSHKGLRTPAKELPLPLQIKGSTWQAWREADTEFWDGMDPAGQLTLVVTMPDATSRSLPIRFTGGGDDPLDIDPGLMAESVYDQLKFTAEDPYWRTNPVSELYRAINALPFFAPPGQVPPGVLNIAPANTIATGTVTNPGTQPASPLWITRGPYSKVTVGVGDSLVVIEADVGPGEQRIINMDRHARNITDENGDRAWLDATQIKFSDIPPGSEVPLQLAVVDPGVGTEIELQFVPRFRRYM